MSEEKMTVYARKNRAKKWGTTYHIYRGSCPMIKNKPDIEAVEFDDYVKDMTDRKKEFSLCKACERISHEKAKEAEPKDNKKEEKADSKKEDKKEDAKETA